MAYVSPTQVDVYEAGDPLPPPTPPNPTRVNPQLATVTSGSTVNILNDSEDGMTVIEGTGPLATLTIALPSYAVAKELQRRNIVFMVAVNSLTFTVQGGGAVGPNFPKSILVNDDIDCQVVKGAWMGVNL